MKILEVEASPSGYWKMSVDTNWDEIGEAEQWCQTTQCGKKIALRQFGFRNEDEMTMFRLRWVTE